MFHKIFPSNLNFFQNFRKILKSQKCQDKLEFPSKLTNQRVKFEVNLKTDLFLFYSRGNDDTKWSKTNQPSRIDETSGLIYSEEWTHGLCDCCTDMGEF